MFDAIRRKLLQLSVGKIAAQMEGISARLHDAPIDDAEFDWIAKAVTYDAAPTVEAGYARLNSYRMRVRRGLPVEIKTSREQMTITDDSRFFAWAEGHFPGFRAWTLAKSAQKG